MVVCSTLELFEFKTIHNFAVQTTNPNLAHIIFLFSSDRQKAILISVYCVVAPFFYLEVFKSNLTESTKESI